MRDCRIALCSPVVLTGIVLWGVCLPLWAEFALNFTPNSAHRVSDIANVECNGSGGGMGGGGWGGGGGMGGSGFRGCGSGYFLQEVVNDGGTTYYHIIVGDVATDSFAQEIYIRDGASGGSFDNWAEPLNPDPSVSGIGTGQPSRLYMRQLLLEPDFDQELNKSTLSQKPIISQNMLTSDVQSEFLLDMSNSNYSQLLTADTVVNKQTVLDVMSGMVFTDFDVSQPGVNADITAGRFRYSSGNYDYEGGDFNVFAVDWVGFCDPVQNPDHACDLSSGAGSGWDSGGMTGSGWGW